MKRHKLLFVTTQFYKGGAEVALLNLFRQLSPEQYDVDFLVFDQIKLPASKSLLPEIPAHITVCNASEKEGNFAIVPKIFFRIVQKLTGHQLYRPSAYHFIKDKQYDMAFSYGEWISPEFVAKKVNALKKYVWIHTDIDKAKCTNVKTLFGYDNAIDKYIFVSETSRKSAEDKYSILHHNSVVVPNLCDEASILRLSKEPVEGLEQYKRPLLISIGNLRKEKNYPRQIETMHILKERGIELTWLCIGATSKWHIFYKLKKMVRSYGLENNFIFLGAQDNPYKYMAASDAVMVLSDYESWSMVITEAKLLGIPVIATKTSGAIEQIKEKKDGVLVSFHPEEIADQIQDLIQQNSWKNNP